MPRTAVRLLVLLAFAAVGAMLALPADAQSISIDLGEGGDASFSARLLQLMLIVGVLSLAPALLIMTTSFLRIVVVLALLRYALGLQQTPPNSALVGIALFLTLFVMTPTFDEAWTEGLEPMIAEEISQEEGLGRAVAPVKTFMLSQVEADDLRFFQDLAEARQADMESLVLEPAVSEASFPTEDEVTEPVAPDEDDTDTIIETAAAKELHDIRVVAPAFMISELSRAFEIGFLIFMPFLVIDLAVAAILMSMGMMMLPPATVSLPFKLMFFVLIDGWRIVSGGLVESFLLS